MGTLICWWNGKIRLIADLKKRNSWNVYEVVFLEQFVVESKRQQAVVDLVMCNEADLITELKVKKPLGGSDNKIIEFTLQFEKEKLESDVIVSQLCKGKGMVGKWEAFKNKITRVQKQRVPVRVKGKAG
eukprot:g44029.t1